eukprot:TRINITY_DN50522_c0_g1_i1.p1 TRINITY_DN50522_c0_g1~~TRINITY_DN50522_c0_g1_i1.p1  ORF type:complete len:323 (+),score=65.10 TRINITY_DN50522_c0_g1_i1:89-1057(+)
MRPHRPRRRHPRSPVGSPLALLAALAAELAFAAPTGSPGAPPPSPSAGPSATSAADQQMYPRWVQLLVASSIVGVGCAALVAYAAWRRRRRDSPSGRPAAPSSAQGSPQTTAASGPAASPTTRSGRGTFLSESSQGVHPGLGPSPQQPLLACITPPTPSGSDVPRQQLLHGGGVPVAPSGSGSLRSAGPPQLGQQPGRGSIAERRHKSSLKSSAPPIGTPTRTLSATGTTNTASVRKGAAGRTLPSVSLLTPPTSVDPFAGTARSREPESPRRATRREQKRPEPLAHDCTTTSSQASRLLFQPGSVLEGSSSARADPPPPEL